MKKVLPDITWIKRGLLDGRTARQWQLIIETTRPGYTCPSAHLNASVVLCGAGRYLTPESNPPWERPFSGIFWSGPIRKGDWQLTMGQCPTVISMQMYQRSTGVTDITQRISGWCADWGNVGRGGECQCARGRYVEKWVSVWDWLYRVESSSFVQGGHTGGGCLARRGVDTANAIKWSATRSRGLEGGVETGTPPLVWLKWVVGWHPDESCWLDGRSVQTTCTWD